MKPKYWFIIILSAIVIVLSLLWWTNQPAQDLGPIVVHHEKKTQPQATTPPQSSTDTSGWQTYTNSQYGYELSYPRSWMLQTVQDVGDDTSTINTDFMFPDGTYLFNIEVYTKPVWDAMQTGDGPMPVYLSQKNNLVFTSDYDFQAPINNEKVSFDEITKTLDQIMASFKFSNPTSSSSSQTQADTGAWKTYTNSQYGFSFEYPSTTTISTLTGYMGSDVDMSFYSFSNFKWFLSDGAFEETLTYSQPRQQWVVGLGINETPTYAFCPNALKTISQDLPYYGIGDFQTGRNWEFAYVTKKGIIMISVFDGNLPNRLDPTQPYKIDPAQIKFNNPSNELSVSCGISK